MAGNKAHFYALTREERLELRRVAKQMHDNGSSFVRAQINEQSDMRGFVYVIVNPAWEDYCKIGRAFDPESRLRGYQTASPFRDFELHGARYFDNAAQAELEIHLRLSRFREQGEWFYLDPRQALVEIDKLQEQLYVG